MSSLNARIGRTLPSPSVMLIRHRVYVRPSASRRRTQTRISPTYVGALLVAAVLLLLGISIIGPRPAADPSECSRERPPADAVLGAASAVG